MYTVVQYKISPRYASLCIYSYGPTLTILISFSYLISILLPYLNSFECPSSSQPPSPPFVSSAGPKTYARKIDDDVNLMARYRVTRNRRHDCCRRKAKWNGSWYNKAGLLTMMLHCEGGSQYGNMRKMLELLMKSYFYRTNYRTPKEVFLFQYYFDNLYTHNTCLHHLNPTSP